MILTPGMGCCLTYVISQSPHVGRDMKFTKLKELSQSHILGKCSYDLTRVSEDISMFPIGVLAHSLTYAQ